MQTKSIPAMVMLTAGLVASIAGISGRMSTIGFTKMLLIVLIVFYVLGGVVKMILDQGFKEIKEEETMDGEDPVSEEETGEGEEEQKDE